MYKQDDDFKLFLEEAFIISSLDFNRDKIAFASAGRYVEKHGNDFIFLFSDASTGAIVVAGAPSELLNIQKDFSTVEPPITSVAGITELPFFKTRKLEFHDEDHVLEYESDFVPFDKGLIDIREIRTSDRAKLQNSCLDCTEDEKETLDLNLGQDFALGLFIDDKIAGVARYAELRETGIADITVVLAAKYRRKGLSTPLVSALISHVLIEGLIPKYRVGHTNFASLSIAKRLGFKPRFELQAWRLQEV